MIEQIRCSCGNPTGLEIPDDLKPEYQESLRRMGAFCDTCEAKAKEVDDQKHARLALFAAESRAKSSGIPKQLQAISWEQLEVDAGNRDAIAAAKRWAQGGRTGVALTGEIGVGKTTIAAAAAWEYLGHGRLSWTSMPKLFRQLSNYKDAAAQRIAKELTLGMGALVLDDLDKARPSDYGADVTFGVIDHRLTEGLPLLITMNLDYVQIAQKFPAPFGEAIASRLTEHCGVAIDVKGSDRRIPPPAELLPLPGLEPGEQAA